MELNRIMKWCDHVEIHFYQFFFFIDFNYNRFNCDAVFTFKDDDCIMMKNGIKKWKHSTSVYDPIH